MSSEAMEARLHACIFRHASTGSPVLRFHGNDGAKLSVCTRKTGASDAEPWCPWCVWVKEVQCVLAAVVCFSAESLKESPEGWCVFVLVIEAEKHNIRGIVPSAIKCLCMFDQEIKSFVLPRLRWANCLYVIDLFPSANLFVHFCLPDLSTSLFLALFSVISPSPFQEEHSSLCSPGETQLFRKERRHIWRFCWGSFNCFWGGLTLQRLFN